jgi:hypothetical protein
MRVGEDGGKRSRSPLFVKRSSLYLDLREGEKNRKNREKRGIHDFVAV